jgi:hypothetical protein
MSNLEQTKSNNQNKEYYLRNKRIDKYLNDYKNYSMQQDRIIKQISNFKFKDENGNNLWKKNLKNEDGEYDLVYFVYPERKIYKFTKYKLQAVTNRLLNEKRYMSFLAGKIKRNKY